MKPKYQQYYHIKAPYWMNDALKYEYQIRVHNRQKHDRTKLSKLEW